MQWETYLRKMEAYQARYQNQTLIVKKIQAVCETVCAYQAQRLPQKPLPKLTLSQGMIYRLLDQYADIMTLASDLLNLRQVLIENFGIWHVCNQVWVADVKNYLGPKVGLELMAGNGSLGGSLGHTRLTDSLKWRGQDVTHPHPWYPLEKLDALEAVQKYASESQVIWMAWAPDQGQKDWEILQWLQQVGWSGEFYVIGEKNGATNSSRFWQEAQLELLPALNLHHQPFDFIKDYVYRVNIERKCL